MNSAASPATLLHVGDLRRGQAWQALLPELVPGLTVRQWPDIGDRGAVRYVAAWAPPAELFAGLPALEVVFSIGAGVDHLDVGAIPGHIPLVRMVEPGLVAGMIEYATMATLALHCDLLGHAERHRSGGEWMRGARREACGRRIGIMGLGAMGAAIAGRLVAFGFPVAGWSRSPHEIAGVTCHAGMAALPAFLASTDILICVLPLTGATRGIIDTRLLAALPAGAGIVNIGRGGHVDEAALLDAVRSGHIGGAILDVTAVEPLPADHPFRSEPRILVTPHIAGTTDVEGGARAIAANILRHRRGEPLVGLVDRDMGY